MLKSEIKTILKTANIKINKVLGQNFLIDQKVVQDMVEAADLTNTDTVLEVGPGLGILTEKISQNNHKVLAIEKDKNLVPYLKNKFKNNKNVEIINQDILKLQTTDYELLTAHYKIIANLPFYLTSRFLRLFLEYKNKPTVMVLLMQKEVAERIVAQKDKSILSIACELYSEPKIIRQVSRKSFYPKPDIDCAIIKFKVFKKPQYDIEDIKLFFRIVKAGFSARRKQIHNNLAAGLSFSSSQIKKILKKVNIDPQRRAQTLSLEEWYKLYKTINN